MRDMMMGAHMPAQQVQPQQAPQQGGMMEQSPLPSQDENTLPPYNGVIQFEGEQVEVVDGTFEIDGETILVSDDGSIVMTDEQDVLGRIENGVFVEVDDAQIARLKDLGMME